MNQQKVDANSDEIRATVLAVMQHLVIDEGFAGAELMAFATRFFISISKALIDTTEDDPTPTQTAILTLLSEIERVIMDDPAEIEARADRKHVH